MRKCVGSTPLLDYSRDNPDKIFRRVQDKDRRNSPKRFDPTRETFELGKKDYVGVLNDAINIKFSPMTAKQLVAKFTKYSNDKQY